jgi:hypothetical protein
MPISNQAYDVAYWDFAAFAATHHFVAYWATTDKGRSGGLIDTQRLTQSGPLPQVYIVAKVVGERGLVHRWDHISVRNATCDNDNIIGD